MSFVTEVCGDSALAEPCAASGATEHAAAATTAHHRARFIIRTSEEVSNARCTSVGMPCSGSAGKDSGDAVPAYRDVVIIPYYVWADRSSSTRFQVSGFGPSPVVKRIVRVAPA